MDLFSQLGPLFKTTMRQAESADTRLQIRRDEKQEHEKKDQLEKEVEDESLLWNDSTTVSVEALKTFLSAFLKTKGIESEITQTGPAEDVVYKPEPLKPTTTVAARAMKAYGSHTAQDIPPPPAESETPRATEDLSSLLRTDEIRTMHGLIRELNALQNRGVEFLTIEKADTFLEALVIAVEAEKNRL